MPALLAPLARVLPRQQGRARRGLGAARGVGLGPCAPCAPCGPARPSEAFERPGPAGSLRAPCWLPTLGVSRQKPAGRWGDPIWAGKPAMFRWRLFGWLGPAFPSQPGLSSCSRSQPGVPQGPLDPRSIFGRGHSGPPCVSFPAGLEARTPTPGRLARLPPGPCRRAARPARAPRGEQGGLDGSSSALSPEWMRDVINPAAFINSPV